MQGVHGTHESETASVTKVAREPAFIINGVPDLPPDCTSDSQPEVRGDAESQVDPRFGEWLEGRRVRKLFGDKHYVGKVVQYDSESNWYNVVYDDGDQEDLEWHELEEILLPLDITIPLKTLVMDKCKLPRTVTDYRPKVGRPRKVYAIMEGNTEKTSDMAPISQGNDVMGNQMLVTGMENGQQLNNVPELLPASTSNDTMSCRLPALAAGENAQVCPQDSNQPRKRGRPRKDRTVSGGSQPKKRGRPPKNRSTSGHSQSAESTPGSLALVPVQDARDVNVQEASKKQNGVLMRNMQTARAEKLKRENLRVQGAPPGTQLF